MLNSSELDLTRTPARGVPLDPCPTPVERDSKNHSQQDISRHAECGRGPSDPLQNLKHARLPQTNNALTGSGAKVEAP